MITSGKCTPSNGTYNPEFTFLLEILICSRNFLYNTGESVTGEKTGFYSLTSEILLLVQVKIKGET